MSLYAGIRVFLGSSGVSPELRKLYLVFYTKAKSSAQKLNLFLQASELKLPSTAFSFGRKREYLLLK